MRAIKAPRKASSARILILMVLAGLTAYGFGKYVRGVLVGSPGLTPRLSLPPVRQGTAVGERGMPQASARSVRARSSAKAHPPGEAAERDFRGRYGKGLRISKGPDGFATAITGAPGKGEPAAEGFSPTDAEQALARAREVLDDAAELLGIDPSLPLQEPSVRTGPVSAQVEFSEARDGIKLVPTGSVSVDLGPRGEVLGISSDYVRGVDVVNERRLTREQAQAKAEAAVQDPGAAFETFGGLPILWVRAPERPGAAVVARHAFGFTVGGRRIVVDADNGDVLSNRDRRQY